ncbi:MAG: hypothetical protein ABIQ30_05325 [Devosia sp.]
MPHPLPSPAHFRRLKRVTLRLLDLLDSLDLPDRKAQLPARFAGQARRTLGDAEELLHGDLLPPAGTRQPADLFVSTLLNLKLISDANGLTDRSNFR